MIFMLIEFLAIFGLAAGITADATYTVRGLSKGLALEGNGVLAFCQRKFGVDKGTVLYSVIEFLIFSVPAAFAPAVPWASMAIGACFAMAIKHVVYGALAWKKLGA